MNIALMAHDEKKELMVQFCIAYCGILSKHNLCATGTTGKLVSEATGLKIQLCISASAVAIFVATGILCTSQSLKRLFSLGSCGFGLSGSRNIKRRSISLQAIRAPICWSPPCEPLKKILQRQRRLYTALKEAILTGVIL